MQDNNIIKLKHRKEFSIGIIIFIFILIYLVINIVRFYTKKHVSLYEVEPGSIYVSSESDAIILREEKLFASSLSGYINYYFPEGSRIKKQGNIYSIDSTKNIYSNLLGNDYEIKLSKNDVQKLKNKVWLYIDDMNSNSEISYTKSLIKTEYNKLIDMVVMDELNEIVRTTGMSSDFQVISSDTSGIISYYTDIYGDLKVSDVTEEMFTNKTTMTNVFSTDIIPAGSCIYKLITSDEWTLVSLLNDSTYEKLKDQKKLSFRINNSENVYSSNTSFFEKNGKHYVALSLSDSVSDYTEYRFVKLKFEISCSKGLKIPESSITFKDYYRIPESYFALGGNSNTKGLIICTISDKDGSAVYSFFQPEIFCTLDGFSYIDAGLISSDTYILESSTRAQTMLYTFNVKVEGAYNLNNGYASFRRIERIMTDNNYCIVKAGSTAGLSAYDHISLDAQSVTEGEVIY